LLKALDGDRPESAAFGPH
jgi:hypothetical protein